MRTSWTAMLWSVIFIVLTLLPTVGPIFNVFLAFLAIPIVILYVILDKKNFLIHMIVSGIIIIVLVGMNVNGLLVYVFVALSSIVPGIIIGHFLKNKQEPLKTFVAGCGITMLMNIIGLWLVTYLFDLNLLASLDNAVNKIKMMMYPPLQIDIEQVKLFFYSSLPATFTICSIIATAITYALSRRMLKIMGIETLAFKPVRDWMLPRSIVFYYFIAVIFNFSVKAGYSYINLASATLILLAQFAFIVQTFSFFSFLSLQKKWHPIVPYLIAISIVIIPPLTVIGMMDMLFPMRRNFDKPKM